MIENKLKSTSEITSHSEYEQLDFGLPVNPVVHRNLGSWRHKTTYELTEDTQSEPESSPAQSEDLNPTEISRRKFLIGSAGVIAGAFLGGALLGKIVRGEPLLPFEVPELPFSEKEVKNGKILLGEEINLDLRELGVSWTPDGHIPYVTFPDGKRKFFISGGAECFVIESEKPVTLEEAIRTAKESGQKARRIFGPDESIVYRSQDRGDVHYRNGYSAITTAIQTDENNPYHLVGFSHNEEWMGKGNGHNYTASISLVESRDGGETWSEKLLIAGDNPQAPGGERVQGVGQPYGIRIGNEIFLYYVDWMGYKRGQPDQVYLAKMPINQDGTAGEIEHYTVDGFNKEYNPGKLKSVIQKPNIPQARYAALPGVSFNDHLNQNICIFEVDKDGADSVFCKTTSQDGINWSTNPEVFFSRNQLYERDNQVPAKWNSYPNLLSDSEKNSDQVTGGVGTLYYAKSDGSPHNLVARRFEITS